MTLRDNASDPPVVAADIINAVEAEGSRRREACLSKAAAEICKQNSKHRHNRIYDDDTGIRAGHVGHDHWAKHKCNHNDPLFTRPDRRTTGYQRLPASTWEVAAASDAGPARGRPRRVAHVVHMWWATWSRGQETSCPMSWLCGPPGQVV